MSDHQGNGIFRLRPDIVENANQTSRPAAAVARPASGYEEKPYTRMLVVLVGFALMGLVLVAQLVRYQALGKRYQVLGGSAVAAVVNPLAPRGGIF